MDKAMSSNNCGSATGNSIDPSIQHDLGSTDEPVHESKQNNAEVKDATLPDSDVHSGEIVDQSTQNKLNNDLENPPDKSGSEINVEQKEFVSQELSHNDTNTIESNSDEYRLDQLPGNAKSVTVDEKTPTAADDIASESPKTVNDEEHTKPISDVIPSPPLTSVKIEKDADPNQSSSSLALLAQYDTDSDDDVCEVPVPLTYQNRCVEIDSDSSTSDVEFLSEKRDTINLDMFDNEVDDDEEDEGNNRTSRQPRVKGELQLEDLPPIEDLHITVPEEECTELGKIHSIVEQLVLVSALPGTVPLDLETVLFRDKGRKVLGEVFDVLGQVSDPLYCVRFNSNKEIKEKGIEVGQLVYVAPRTEHTQFIVLANLMKVRGSDASWENDVEPPPRFIDYSDDEEERSARRPNRKRQSSGGLTYSGRGTYTPRRPYRGNYSSRGVRQPHSQGNYNMVGNSWHSNFNQAPMFNQPQYQMPGHLQSGYIRQNFNNNSPYQHPPPINPGLVVNPYAIYPPPQGMQQPLFPPPHLQQPPPSQ
ncbi:H/ACA ribonucleoprotein complex non-core subunit NAF1 [Episyrphus balteatus]|uniref:H/ACA ribonucleoprotein complex non-core subunit NAF1 n=1 Tax=Episyrphus balteatus TaxID=286459 RepID=UPI0024858F63|nr:H/ACA ribonucleoprotein complex non-core subunit NAF1 [Episyrphus balteatus]